MAQQGATRPGRFGSIGVLRRVRMRHRHGGGMPWLLQRGIWQRGFDPGITTLNFSDSGAGADAISSLATKIFADSGAGTDSLARVATKAFVDTGSGSDVTGKVATALRADSGASSDAVAMGDTLTLGDSGTGSDTLRSALAATRADSGGGLDSWSRTAAAARTDTGSGSDAVLRSVVLSLADSGSGGDVYDERAATGLNFADAGGGVDQTSSSLSMLRADAGSGSDNLFIGGAPPAPVPEPGSGLGWLEQGAPARGRRSRGRVPALRQRALPASAVTLSLADVGGGEDLLGMLFMVSEPPLYVSDILTAEPDLTEEVVDLLLAGVL